jgi:hypothetical protein
MARQGIPDTHRPSADPEIRSLRGDGRQKDATIRKNRRSKYL